MLRSFLLAPCLLISLACATPFPIENLEDGMTAEIVREIFGEPEAIETNPWGQVLSLTYVDEELLWGLFGFLVPPFWLSVPICAAIPDTPWDCFYINTRPVLLHFGAKKLASWDVGEWAWTPDPAPSTFSMSPGIMDWQHHQQGHTHHHGHGC